MKYTVMSATHNAPIAHFDTESEATKAMETYNMVNDTDTAYIKKEETTMKTTINLSNSTATFTAADNTIYTYYIETKRYAKTTTDGKTKRISKAEYEAAEAEYELYETVKADIATEEEIEQEQAELDAAPCYVDPMADLQKPAIINEFGCVDCSGCRVKPCVHRDCMRRNPKDMGGLAECPRLSNGILGGGQKIAEEEGIEPAEAELEANIRKTKKARKARKSKDIAYEGNSVTLTAKQVDFIRHLSDSCFWEHGIESALWIDVLCDEIGGQFAGRPMTVGAMVSTLCEKGLATRAKDKVNGRTSTYMVLTELGQTVAVDLGLQ